jgi:peptidoglycan/xylan/chitin deacetylase (PgdA/CDA1 family)
MVGSALPATAAPTTLVSLTFDDNTAAQFTLAYQQVLQPNGVTASFFVDSGTIGSSANFMTWSQVATLALAGNDIGGKTVHGVNLKTSDTATKIREVCDDRAALLQHGLDARTFAYPYGAFDQAAKDVVRSCGYGNARTSGSLSPSGPVFAETIPPRDYFATRAYAPSGAVALSALQTLVTNASTAGGGWTQIVLTKVCSQALQPAAYPTCAKGTYIELETLRAFVTWVRNAGGAGGAPAGTAFADVKDVVDASDRITPTSTIACEGQACGTGPYVGYAEVALAATDTGSGLSVIRYTTDGTTPTASSPAYTGPFKLRATATVAFRAWDVVGNVEPVRTQGITIDPVPASDSTPPVTAISCDGAPCASEPYALRVSVSLSATDTGGSGLDETYYTLDGTIPTTGSTLYAGPFVVDRSSVVRFFSTDRTGNAEQPGSTTVSVNGSPTHVAFTWDDGTISQYELAFERALLPHGVDATYYVNSGTLGTADRYMTWADVQAIEASGSEIGGHTVDHVIVKGLDAAAMNHQICDDRASLVDHGLHPTSFAYPEGAFDAASESVAEGCGYENARSAGSITLGGPIYAETIPPKDDFSLRAWSTPSGPQMSLADLQTLVWNASSHGGGLVPIVGHFVCSETYDPDDYASCRRKAGSIELDTLNAFLDWMHDAGEPGGAPGRATVGSIRDGLT